jgi:hypothetical protein
MRHTTSRNLSLVMEVYLLRSHKFIAVGLSYWNRQDDKPEWYTDKSSGCVGQMKFHILNNF